MRGVSNCTCRTGLGCLVVGWIFVSLVHRLFEWSTGAGYSIAFRGGGRACRWIARAIGAQWPLAYETRGRGLPLDPRLLVWEGESLPAAADLTILSYDEFSQAQLRGAPLIIDQVGRRVPREVATVVDVRRDGRVIRVQERRGRDWKTLFKNVSADDAEALEPVSLPHDDDYWSSNGQTDWWSSLRDVISQSAYAQTGRVHGSDERNGLESRETRETFTTQQPQKCCLMSRHLRPHR